MENLTHERSLPIQVDEPRPPGRCREEDDAIEEWLGLELAIEVIAKPLDRLPDVVFFAKDREGRYVRANQTLVAHCGKRHKREVLGRTAEEVGTCGSPQLSIEITTPAWSRVSSTRRQ